MGTTIAIAIATLIVACVLVFDPLDLGVIDYLRNYGSDSTQIFENTLLISLPAFILRTSKTAKDKESNFHHTKGLYTLFNSKKKRAKISVFKGREAKLNYAIFKSLATNGPQTIIDLHKKLSKQKDLEGTYYASLTKRIRCLETAGYITQAPDKLISTGFKVTYYELHAKAYLATFLNITSPETVLNNITEENATIVLSDLINTVLANQK